MSRNILLLFHITVFFLGVSSLDLVPDFLKADIFNIYRHAAVETREIAHTPVKPETVTLFLYTKEQPKQYTQIYPHNLDLVAKTNRKIALIIHGWINSKEIEWYEKLTTAFLTTHGDEYCVLQVDWKEPAHQFYYVSSINTYDVARILADVIIKLHEEHGVKVHDILPIGHSLGGQITGFIGKHIYKKTNEKFPRIIALDPAGPLFDTRPEDKRLNKDDAKVVEVLHTDGGTFGFLSACGTIDFYANGGSSQPGCKRIDLLDIKTIIDPVSCDHMRAPEYFIEAILNPDELLASRCDSWKSFADNQCGETVSLGDLSTTATGDFYFETNKEKPFSKSGKSKSGFGIEKILPILNL